MKQETQHPTSDERTKFSISAGQAFLSVCQIAQVGKFAPFSLPDVVANPLRMDYSLPVAEKKAIRFGSLNGAANGRKRNVCGFFISSGVSSMAGRAGEPQGSPVLHRSSNPVRSASLLGSGEAGSKPQLERAMQDHSRVTSVTVHPHAAEAPK